jgi:hypothetical protein
VDTLDGPLDLASRIGMPGAHSEAEEPLAPALAELVRRHDGPIETSRASRPVMIGANEPLPQPFTPPAVPVAPAVRHEPDAVGPAWEFAPLVVTLREAPAAGEMDLVVTPLATPDDWHHFELALRRLPGVGPLRIEYYRAGILKLRVRWSGAGRFAQALAKVPGYRIGILGEDRSTVQIRVARA